MAQVSTALVTGATGFIGKHLVESLIQRGNEVHVIVRPTSDLSKLGLLEQKLKFHIHEGSTERLLDIVGRIKPDIVFHLASMFVAEHTTFHVEDLIKSNLLFATQLLECMVENGVYKLINTGTPWQHFRVEDKTYNPVCLYAATKQAFEDIIKFYTEAKGINSITLKVSDTYGPRDHRKKLFYHLKKAAAEGVTLRMSPGEQLLDLVYIDDVIDAFLQADALLHLGSVDKMDRKFSVSSGSCITLKEIVALYNRLSHKKVQVEWGGRAYRQREVMKPWIGEMLPSWEAKIPLEIGLRKVID